MNDNCPINNQPCPYKKNSHVVKNGSELNVCELCKNKIEKQSLISGVIGFLAMMFLGNTKKRIIEKPQKCLGCETTPQDIISSGRFGCPKCYDSYKNSIENILSHCQAGREHIGKVPSKETTFDIKSQIKNLESKMANAIKLEKYETAGALKLEIQELRQKLNGS